MSDQLFLERMMTTITTAFATRLLRHPAWNGKVCESKKINAASKKGKSKS